MYFAQLARVVSTELNSSIERTRGRVLGVSYLMSLSLLKIDEADIPS